MYVILNEQNYVISYAIFGIPVDAVQVPDPEDYTHFLAHYRTYKLEDNNLVFDAERGVQLEQEERLEELRERRKNECFAYVDRSKFWYDSLTPAQLAELDEFYEAWLQVTTTFVIPERPEWLV